MSLLERFENKYIPEPMSGCWIWHGALCNGGYGQLGKGANRILAHRAAWQLYNGPIPTEKCVLHNCDVPSCVNPSHLFLGTLKENTQDGIQKGRIKIPFGEFNPPKGSSHRSAKLNDCLVKEIRVSQENGSIIAKRLKVSQTTISQIRHGKLWKHLLD